MATTYEIDEVTEAKIEKEENEKDEMNINAQAELNKQENEIEERGKIIDARNARIRELDQFISNIINSKGWKTLEKLREVKKKVLRK